jgi:natural product biosynthesis luciferase-like monooxygenase protein
MSNISDRIRNLTREQQDLLRRRMQREQKTPETSSPARTATPRLRRNIDFSLFFFSADGTATNEDRYNFLQECARFADRNGFSAVWTPERHFQTFGGLYPNPSVLSAALAMITERVQIRAGSLVLPLHNPVRVAEDWALVDNLSHGRTAISFATGWHEHDYVIAPANFEDRRELMFRNIDVVRRLWAGEAIEMPGVGGKKTAIKTLPRPVQPQLPFWVTVTSSRTWQRAGEIGANVLTALSGSLDDLGRQIATYRKARMENGRDPRTGIVSLMLHTYVGTDLEHVRNLVREPLKNYLQNYINQWKPMVADGLTDSSSIEVRSLLDLVFEKYFEEGSLLGTPEKCASMVEKVGVAGVNDIACLVDFGLDLATTLASLERLTVLRHSLEQPKAAALANAKGE